MRCAFFRLAFVLFGVVCTACSDQDKLFTLLTSNETGITFVNRLNPTEDLNILTYLYYYNGAGVVIGDFNNDNLDDIYFTGNQVSGKLYLNKGHFKFEDVTVAAGIENSNGWTTGATHVDINNDGLLDLYVCKVGGYRNLDGVNLLYINQGSDKNGVPAFREDAASYGLDISTLSTQSAFFDYDLDGDLDMFLLTHSVHPNRSYGNGSARSIIDPHIGDKLMENQNGKFVDVTTRARIFQNRIGYGLGLSVGDLNGDGYPDIYVGNDFFENDYCYQNNGDGTFTELISTDPTIFGHTSHYSMGNCIADLNNDTRPDIVSLDMLPEDLVTFKSSGVEDGFPIYQQFLNNGYAPQYMQNTLHLNRGPNVFSEIAYQSGIASTEWSWGALAGDFDLDGWKDLYISNGIVGATNDMDYINFISQNDIQRELDRGNGKSSMAFAKKIPAKKTRNYVFRNVERRFENATENWFDAPASFSNGCAFADLDNDGDLDIVVNNIDDEAFVFENKTIGLEDRHYIRMKFRGGRENPFGIGARVIVYSGGNTMHEENFPVRSYLSSAPPFILLGTGSVTRLDSIVVWWPNRTRQVVTDARVDTTFIFNQSQGHPHTVRDAVRQTLLVNVDSPVDFVHRETTTLDFDRDALVPFALSNEGPKVSVADVNADSLDDLFISGAKGQASALYVQMPGGEFVLPQPAIFQMDARAEDIDHVFVDVDGDDDPDLVVVSGGNEFPSGEPLRPRLYINQSGSFTKDANAFEGLYLNASVVRALDLDNDGDHDLVFGANASPTRFGEAASNYIFVNEGNALFRDATAELSAEFGQAGLINDIATADMDGNGFQDLITVGDWMPVTLFLNDGKSLSRKTIPETEGWWNAICVSDFDGDGDYDLVAGNWGQNTRLTATPDQPVELYRNDFDDNGSAETLLTYYYRGTKAVLPSKDELQKQMPFIKKRFTSYSSFAQAGLSDLVPKEKLQNAVKRHATELSSCYFENRGGNDFQKRVLPPIAQQSTVNAILARDFDGDGFLDLLLAGNNYEISTQLGRLDASHGVILLNDKRGFFKEFWDRSLNIAGPARDIDRIVINGAEFYIVAINNSKPILLRKG